MASWPAGAPGMSTGPGIRRALMESARSWPSQLLTARVCPVLLSFERPARESPGLRPRRTLKTAQLAKQKWRDHRVLFLDPITVKIIRAHGGCLGTRSR